MNSSLLCDSLYSFKLTIGLPCAGGDCRNSNPDTECVDDLSLILETKDTEDERIQNCLDEIKNKYGIEVDEVW